MLSPVSSAIHALTVLTDYPPPLPLHMLLHAIHGLLCVCHILRVQVTNILVQGFAFHLCYASMAEHATVYVYVFHWQFQWLENAWRTSI